jgi:heme-degrading monooxygenase HmoA
MPGAIGVVLYMDLLSKTGGSLSIWASEADLRRFVTLPRHRAVMRRYRDRVDVRATTWMTENFSVREAMNQGAQRLERC